MLANRWAKLDCGSVTVAGGLVTLTCAAVLDGSGLVRSGFALAKLRKSPRMMAKFGDDGR